MRPVGPSTVLLYPAHRPHSCTNENLTWTPDGGRIKQALPHLSSDDTPATGKISKGTGDPRKHHPNRRRRHVQDERM
jgi:hypothetical protein